MTNRILLVFAAAVPNGADPKAEKRSSRPWTPGQQVNETKAEAIKADTECRTKIEAIDLMNNSIRVDGDTALVKGKEDVRNNNGGQVSTAHLDVLHVWIEGSTVWHKVSRQALRLNPQ